MIVLSKGEALYRTSSNFEKIDFNNASFLSVTCTGETVGK